MHRCADIHNGMSNLTSLLHKTSEQHVELGVSRINRDNADLQKVIGWFECHNPFDLHDHSLRSLSTGLTATEDNNLDCDEAELVGKTIQQSLNNLCLEDAKIKRNDQVKTFEYLRPGITIDRKIVRIDPLILFTRLTALMQREGCIADQFSYELTPEPSALFKDGMMRKANKSILRNRFLDKTDAVKDTTATCCVVDGGAVLHKVKWVMNVTFKDILTSYTDYMKNRYGRYERVCVVFYGYTDEMSIKTSEHTRRSTQLASANVRINEMTAVTANREIFLRNSKNKEHFIQLLSMYLCEAGIETVHSTGDADVLIVQTAAEIAANRDVVVAAEDTDILILLMHHWTPDMCDIYFNTERKAKSAKTIKSWNIRDIVEGPHMVDNILLAHAWSGCDSTWIGKK